jgi:universal stress protein E
MIVRYNGTIELAARGSRSINSWGIEVNKDSSFLVILDKPKHAQIALRRALEIAGSSGAHLHLVSFCHLPMVEHRDVFDVHQRRQLKRAVLKERSEWLLRLVEEEGLASSNISLDTVWAEDIAAWVAEQVGTSPYAMVMKTVHRSRTLTHTPLDWQLLRTCPVPVYLAVGRSKHSGNVLATIDLRHVDSKHLRLNAAVLTKAQTFAEAIGGRMHCIHVVESLASIPVLNPPKNVARAFKARADEMLSGLLAPYHLPRNRVHVPYGKVGASIAQVASSIKADVVVVGSAANRNAGLVLFGNSAEKILTHSNCDVLVVHP